MSLRKFLCVIAPLVFTLLTLHDAQASTIIPMADADLAVSARVIVEGRVVTTTSRWDAEAGVARTFVTVDVERSFKGPIASGQIVLDQPGGITADGVTIVHGSPEFRIGERVLLFLNTDDHGALHVAHLSIGYYRIETDPATNRVIVSRPYDEVLLLPARDAATITDAADHARFVETLTATLAAQADRVAAFDAEWATVPVRTVPTDFAAGLERGGIRPSYTFLGTGYRWFESDAGGAVSFYINPRSGPSASNGVDEARAALAAWSNVRGSSLRVVDAGRTQIAGFRTDGVNTIAFGDPHREIDDPINGQGIVARGGITNASYGTAVAINGKSFGRISEGDVIVNNGFEALFANPTALPEVLTHELGHALGFGHSSDSVGETNPVRRDATMFLQLHVDGRGAALRQDDMDGARFLYAGSSGRALELTTDAVPNAVPGSAYSFALTAAGGVSPYSWSIAEGFLPTGMALTADGVLTGAVASATSREVTLRVRDGAGVQQTRRITITVTAAPAPFIQSVKYAAESGKLTVTGRYLDDSTTVVVNGSSIPSARVNSFNAAKQRLKLTGSTAELNIRTGSSNTVIVITAGRSSNAATL